MNKKIKTIVSTGFGNFHMLMTAEEAKRYNVLLLCIGGAYPTVMIEKIIHSLRLQKNQKLARLLKRKIMVDERLIVPMWLAESVHEIALKVRYLIKKQSGPIYLDYIAQLIYQNRVKTMINRVDNVDQGLKIYHFRASYGLSSVRYAKKKGYVTLCDHSLADPRLLNSLVNENGLWKVSEYEKLGSVEKAMLRDINEADAVLVNSKFVKETMVFCGCPAEKIHVIYLGVDDDFFNYIPSACGSIKNNTKLKLIFAGMFSRRKGADQVIEALMEMDDVDWELSIAGSLDVNIVEKYPKFFNDKRVILHGLLTRKELASLMAASHVFLFPTRAEGSARVVFEALACGCYIITTNEAGSIVEDGVHGKLVPNSNLIALKEAIKYSDDNLHSVNEIGCRNSDLILNKFRQSHYAEKIIELYEVLC